MSPIFTSLMALTLSVLYGVGMAQVPSDPSCLLQTKTGQQLDDVEDPPGWSELCTACQCDFGLATSSVEDLADAAACAAHCETEDNSEVITFINPPFAGASSNCLCCPSPPVQASGNSAAIMYTKDPDTQVVGDPHIKTLDGRHYTVLSQGTFLLWRLGMETEFHSGEKSKKAPVDWQIYTHYSGHQSFTKGLLLVDMSVGSVQPALEITSQTCEWRARKANDTWMRVSSDSSEFTLDGDATTFNLIKTHGVNYHNRVLMQMNTKDGKTQIALLTLSCRPNHNLNLRITMKRRGDEQHVEGEAQVARKAFSKLQTSATATAADSEFSTERRWQDLGGSDEAAAYLHSVDELERTEPSKTFSTLQSSTFACQDRSEAEKICSKHLGATQHSVPDANFKVFLSDCIFDVCGGAGQTAAELAAELLLSTRAA